MLRAGQVRVNETSFKICRRRAAVVLANDRRCVEKLWTRSRTRLLQDDQVPRRVTPEQTCFGYARCGSAIRLESQPPETLLRAAARERFPRMRVPAPPGISGGAASARRPPLKTFFLGKEARTHRPAAPRHFCFGLDAQFSPQRHGHTRCSSRVPRVCAILPLPRPAPRQFPKRVLPIPNRTKATEALASASSLARATKRKTSSRSDSQHHFPSCALEAQPLPARIITRRVTAGHAVRSEFDYRRIVPIRRSEDANWSALYVEGFSSWWKSTLMAARTSSALSGFASLLYAM